MKLKKEHILLALILIAGFAVRVFKFEDPAMVMDSVAFSRLGKNLIEYGRYAFGENYNMGVFFPPGYPALIGIVNLLFDNLFFSAKVVSFTASMVAILMSYFVGKELYNKEAGLFAALVYAIYPVILIVSVDAYADALFFCLLLLSIYVFLVSLRKESVLCSLLLAIFVSAAFLTRPEGMFLLFLPALQVFGVFNEKVRFDRKNLLKFVLIITIFVMMVSPYMIFLKNYTGKFNISGKANVSIILGRLSGEREYHDIVNAPDNLYDRAAFTLSEDRTQLNGWNRNVNLSLKDYLLENPAAILKKYQKNVMLEIVTLIKLLVPILLPLFFAFFSRDLFRSRKRLIFLMYPCIFFLMYPLFIIIEKQTLVIAVYLIYFSSGGFTKAGPVIAELADYYGLGKNRGIMLLEKNIKAIMLLILVVFSLSYLKYSRFENAPHSAGHMNAGIYLKEHVAQGYEELNVMARKPYANYHSGARFTMIPYAPVSEVIDFAKLYKVDYILVDELSLKAWDHYKELMELHKHSDEVDFVYEDNTEYMVRLFKVVNNDI